MKNIEIFRRILNAINNIDRRYIMLAIVGTLLGSFIPIISLKIMQKIMNVIQTGLDYNTYKLVLTYISMDILGIIFSAGVNYYKQKFSMNFNMATKIRILDKASKLNLKDYESNETYDMLHRADVQSQGEILSWLDSIIALFGSTVSCILYLIIVIEFKWWVSLVLIVVPIIKFMVNKKVNKYEFNIVKSRTNNQRKSWYSEYVITSGINYKELCVYNLFQYFITIYENFSNIFISEDLGIARIRTKFLILFSIVEELIMGACFGYTIYSGYIGIILIGDILMYTKSMISFKEYFQGIMQTMADSNRKGLFIGQLFEFLDLNEDIRVGRSHLDKIKSIEAKNLSFKYPNNSFYTIKNISFKIEYGEKVAIVGCNGCGKSTLLKILTGFYTEYEGELLINGENLRSINIIDYRNRLSSLFQDFTKYEATIKENILFGSLNHNICDAQILKICENLGLNSLVTTEYGLDKQLGYWFENGEQISQGQWQKIALARTLLRNADAYFLDEPNAALDAISEHNMIEFCMKELGTRMGVFIVHKFTNFINKCDKIIVMKGGEIIANGDHENLLTESEEYRNLYMNQ